MTEDTKPSMLKLILSLTKVRITIAVALTTITGYILAAGRFDAGVLLPTLGVFLLACGSAALNQVQERKIDLKMERTRKRPLPSGNLSLSAAWLIILILVTGGSLLLYFTANLTAMLLGWLTLIWYNAIYTPLKRVTPFAVVPGSVIGALPPVIGWVSAGGYPLDPEILIVAFFFFIWQVPHFWLIMMKHGKEYEAAGFPSLTAIMDEPQIQGITRAWVLATAASSMLLAFFGVIDSTWMKAAVISVSLYLLIRFFTPLLSRKISFTQRKAFMTINIYSLMVMIFLVVDRYLVV